MNLRQKAQLAKNAMESADSKHYAGQDSASDKRIAKRLTGEIGQELGYPVSRAHLYLLARGKDGE